MKVTSEKAAACSIALEVNPNTEEGDEQRGLVGTDKKTGHAGWRAPNAIDAAVPDVGAGELRMTEVGAAQVAFAEDDAGEIGSIEVGFDEIAVLEDTVFEASHARQRQIELALMKQHAAPLCLIAGSAGEPRGSDLYAFEHAAGQVDVGQVGILDMRVAHAQPLRAGQRA